MGKRPIIIGMTKTLEIPKTDKTDSVILSRNLSSCIEYAKVNAKKNTKTSFAVWIDTSVCKNTSNVLKPIVKNPNENAPKKTEIPTLILRMSNIMIKTEIKRLKAGFRLGHLVA
jgi:hypothetical protein